MERYLFSDSIEIQDKAPESFVLLKLGDNKFTINGKQSNFTVSKEDIEKILDEFRQRNKDAVIDFDHSTLDKQASAKGDAPAAGWCTLTESEDGIVCNGVKWTDKGKKRIESKEYRYFSPVVQFDKETNRPVSIHSIGLTNHPAIHGTMPLIAANDLLTEGEGVDMQKQLEVEEIVNGYKNIAKQLKDGINGLKEEMSNTLNAMNDIASGYPDVKEEVQEFCDSFFDDDLKAFADLRAFADMTTVQNELNTILEGKPISEVTSIPTLEQASAWIDSQIEIINAENQQLTTGVNDDQINANNQIIDWLKMQKDAVAMRIAELQSAPTQDENAPTVGEVANTMETNEALAANDVQPMLDSEDADTKDLMDRLETAISNEHPDRRRELAEYLINVIISTLNESEEQEETPEEEDKEKRDAIVQQVLAVIAGQTPDTEEAVSFNDIKEGVLLVSDTDEFDAEEAVTMLHGLNDFRDNVMKAFDDLGVKDTEELVKAFNDKTEANKRLEAERIVDKIIYEQPGKLTESMRDWSVKFAMNDLEAFNDYVANAPIAFKSAETEIGVPESPKPVISKTARAIAEQFGNDPEVIYSE